MRVGLVQINMTRRRRRRADDEPAPSFGLLPYSVGLLKAYAVAHAAESHEWLLPIYERVSVSEAADELQDADVVGLSVYVWNVRLSLAIAAELKRRRPGVLIVLGGPQVPERPPAAEAFLRAHPYVDVVCHGEGEQVFCALLDRARDRAFGDVPGISLLDVAGRFETHPKAPRLKGLDEIPSPYVSGAFDDLFAAQPQDRWVMIWETNRGCPFSCAFCDWGSATASKVFRFDMERLRAEIAWMTEREIAFVWTADANFGALKRDQELAEAIVRAYKTTGFPSSITVQSSKNATERVYRIQTLLQREMRAYGVTLSLQSVNDTTLEHINRANISSASYRELQRRFAAEGVSTYTDLILGLPGESYAEFAAGVSRVIADGQHNHIQHFNCSVLPNAEMGDPAYQARYGMTLSPQLLRSQLDLIEEADWEVEEYIDIVVSTDALPADDWRRAKVFAWMVDFTYYDRVLQIPLLMLHARHGWPVHELVEALIGAEPGTYPLLAEMAARLAEKAEAIQRGDPEFFPVPGARGLLWTGDMVLLIDLVRSGRIDDFYAEAGDLLGALLAQRGAARDRVLLDEALTLNRAMLTLPFAPDTQLVAQSHNIFEHYRSLLAGDPVPIEQGFFFHRVNPKRHVWETFEAWTKHIADAHGNHKQEFLHQVIAPRQPSARGAASAA